MNKVPNNKTLQRENTILKFVIIVWTDGCWKYISKTYGYKYGFNYSVKMNKAITFNTDQAAFNFIKRNNLENRKFYICSMKCQYTVSFLDYK